MADEWKQSLSKVGESILAGGMSMIGSMFGNASQQASARQAAEFNAREAQLNREFQQRMSDTSYQRATADMRAAGLNPMLAYTQGGASTPSGSTGSMQAMQMESALGKGVSSALDMRRLRKEIDATDSQVKLNEAAEASKRADTKLAENSAKVAEKNAARIDAEMPAIRAQAKNDARRATIDEKMAETDAIMSRTQQATGILNNAMGAFKPGISWKAGDIGPKPRRGDTLINRKGEVRREY